MRDWVEAQPHRPLGYVKQLYTFADRDRSPQGGHTISVSYLGLTRVAAALGAETDTDWRNWYAFFPWEDHRAGPPAVIAETILPRLKTWAGRGRERQQRVASGSRLRIGSW